MTNDLVSLLVAYQSVLGGVSACSPEKYEVALRRIAELVGRDVDAGFRDDVRKVESSLPCPID